LQGPLAYGTWRKGRGELGDFGMRLTTAAVGLLAATMLSACASGPQGVRVVNGGSSAVPQKEGAIIRNFSAGEIQAAIVGKTFQYTRSDGNGFITYNADGSFEFQDDNKGTGTGRWTASGSQFCESFGNGAALECGVFKNTGDAYFAASSRLVEMKV
jgi:hypothetical protein